MPAPILVPEAPDPVNTAWGAWEKRVNWIVTIVAVVVSLTVGVVEIVKSLAPATAGAVTNQTINTAPQVVPVQPSSVPVEAPDVPTLGDEAVGVAVAVLGAIFPVGCATTAASYNVGMTAEGDAAVRVGQNPPAKGSACCRITAGDPTLARLTTDHSWYCRVTGIFVQPMEFGDVSLRPYCLTAAGEAPAPVPATP